MTVFHISDDLIYGFDIIFMQLNKSQLSLNLYAQDTLKVLKTKGRFFFSATLAKEKTYEISDYFPNR